MSEQRIAELEAENSRLRMLLAQYISMATWIDGGSFAKIEREIKPYGFKLDYSKGDDPKIVPINGGSRGIHIPR